MEEAVACPAVPENSACKAEEAAWNAEIETDFGKTHIRLFRMRCGGARKYPILNEAGEESGKFPKDDRCLHEASLVVFPAVIRCVDLSDALGRYEDDAV